MIILVVEDDPQLREAVVDSLELKGHQVIATADGKQAILALQQQPDLILSDINMPEMDGLALLSHVREEHPWLPMVLMTAYGDVNQAVLAMQRGASDYLMKPFEPSELDALLQPFDVRPQGTTKSRQEEAPVCIATATRQLFQMAERVAQTDSTVLISGESGTGKEVLARYVHQHSQRHKQPFVAINCAAIPENMLEAILFGYEKGAYTGAYQSSAGKFEQAQGGTLLLDEVSEMDAGLQAKLLRVLQERQVERLGGKKVINLDVRIIATTNRDLADHVAEGKFREDLYYRLSVFPLQWLPLRQRVDDILPLAQRLLAHHAHKMKRRVPQLMKEAEHKLLQHSWPGNVRELDNTMQRALILQTGPQLFVNDLLLTPVPGNKHPQLEQPLETVQVDIVQDEGRLGQDLKHREVELILQAIKEEPSRKDAAERLGISPRTLRYKMARLREEGFDVEAMI
ncbi:sigma-54-dependent transcriptional regulator [Candidatus Thalassolituus haligoni]|uniref:sigma-54-dependent transcriptional regulator n=1 Tax=Candidatus Thalassolituus haligoni TaxID=3100113 RepID=UPI0035113421|tara:strand:- start:4908 stop:6278 length:1371 start_codon:yes stop_codon:yes gene_type:complete